MKEVVVSAKARADIETIADYIGQDSPVQALRFIETPKTRCLSLSVHPFQGRPAPEIADEVRLLVFRSYVILHRVLDDHAAIDRNPAWGAGPVGHIR